MKYNLGDRVEYTHISSKYQRSIGYLRSSTSRSNIALSKPKDGYIVGYRSMPIGTIIQYKEDGPDFKQSGTVGCYLVAFNIHQKPDQVQSEFISPYTPTQNDTAIISPYEDALISIDRVIRYEKYGYIYRVERIGFSPDEMDETLNMKVCYSLDGQYLGDNKAANTLCRKFGIREFVKTAEISHPACVGFNSEEQKWYGWSHRAIHGFGIGSSIKKGDCGYKPTNKQDMFDELVEWYSVGKTIDCDKGHTCHKELIAYKHDDMHRDEYTNCVPVNSDEPVCEGTDYETKEEIEYGPEQIGLTMVIKTTFTDYRKPYVNEYFDVYPEQWGKGEWTAETLEDAKEMASDFASEIS